jgi:hypothetical protein
MLPETKSRAGDCLARHIDARVKYAGLAGRVDAFQERLDTLVSRRRNVQIMVIHAAKTHARHCLVRHRNMTIDGPVRSIANELARGVEAIQTPPSPSTARPSQSSLQENTLRLWILPSAKTS